MANDRPIPPASASTTKRLGWRTWLVRHGIFAITLIIGLVLNFLEPSTSKEDRLAESVQTLQVGDASYELLFHKGRAHFSTVRRNGKRVFDTRKSGAGFCLRLRVDTGGRVEAECYGPDGKTTEPFLIP